MALCIGLCSVFGLPWFVAATVLSINHVRSLTRESESSAPGEKPQFLGIRYTYLYIAMYIRVQGSNLRGGMDFQNRWGGPLNFEFYCIFMLQFQNFSQF